MKKILYWSIALFALCSCRAEAQFNFSARIVKDGLFIPWEIIYGPDDHIWFTQKNGYVCRLDPVNGHLDTIYYEPQTVIHNEGGMLGMALQPDFAADPYVYIAYEYESGGNYTERVVKYTYVNGTLQAPQVLIDNIAGGNIHNGCRLAILGDKLYISTGDVGNAAQAQDISAPNGKILRINLDGSIPADNPVPGNPVWSWGHRNAQGLVFHNNVLYSSEHGPNNDDEINIILRGRNYGWPDVQGFCDQPGEMQFCADSSVVEPLYAWTPTLALSGMEYYDHPMFPALAHSLLVTTLKDSKLYQLSLDAAGDSITNVAAIQGINYGRLRDIAIAPDGRIFLSTSNSDADGSGPYVDQIIEIYDPSMTGIFNQYPDQGMLLVYPNPAVDMMNIAFLDPAMNGRKWHYTISNIQGEVLREDRLEFYNLHVGSLYPGIYFLKLWDEKNEVAYKRFVKW